MTLALDDESPMMRQYLAIKQQYPEHLLLFRMGDFYETFNEDAKAAARALNIALTQRGTRGKDGPPIPLAGIPYHQLDNYLAKLLRAGIKVAVAEQMEDPKQAKGIVRREVVRVVTPGTLVEDNLLQDRAANWLVSLWREVRDTPAKSTASLLPADGLSREETWGLAAADLSTGRLRLAEWRGRRARRSLRDELARLDPAELLLPESLDVPTGDLLEAPGVTLSRVDDSDYRERPARELLCRQLEVQSLEGYGADDMPAAIRAGGALIHYLRLTQKRELRHLTQLEVAQPGGRMALDATTQRSLELVEPLHHQARRGNQATLLGVLDGSITSMGGRMLREWLLEPLSDITQIEARLEAVEALVNDDTTREALAEALTTIHDLQRITARAALGNASPRDLVSLRASLRSLPAVIDVLQPLPARSSMLAVLAEAIEGHAASLADLRQLLEALVEQPPATIKEGGLIREGAHPQLDELRQVAHGSKEWIARMRQDEVARTGIDSLKIGYNRVFGYYIEISRAQLQKTPVPHFYQRRQTLANAERFITPELKEKEEIILHAEERSFALEEQLFTEMRQRTSEHVRELHALAMALATVDALLGLARVAVARRYVRPQLFDDGRLEIEGGRHPVLEAIQPDPNQPFIPNDTTLSPEACRIMLITGPNMAGKSTYIRQVALITLMAHMGSFVPATAARIGKVDRIFTRVGAMDHLARGQSTFLVEMSETANILNNCTDHSLVILDEIGRGTSTYDGLSIAWAVVEYLHQKQGRRPRTLFATHYHELANLEQHLPHVRNFSVAVLEDERRITFLYRIQPGPTDRSYGIYAAKLAGMPRAAIERAEQILRELEAGQAVEVRGPSATPPSQLAGGGQVQLNLFESFLPHPVVERLRGLDTDNLTPMAALQLLADLKKQAKKDNGAN